MRTSWQTTRHLPRPTAALRKLNLLSLPCPKFVIRLNVLGTLDWSDSVKSVLAQWSAESFIISITRESVFSKAFHLVLQQLYWFWRFGILPRIPLLHQVAIEAIQAIIEAHRLIPDCQVSNLCFSNLLYSMEIITGSFIGPWTAESQALPFIELDLIAFGHWSCQFCDLLCTQNSSHDLSTISIAGATRGELPIFQPLPNSTARKLRNSNAFAGRTSRTSQRWRKCTELGQFIVFDSFWFF